MSKTKLWAYIFLFLTVAWCLVIWSFSAKNAEQSTFQSERVSEVIIQIIEKVSQTSVNITDGIVRKFAHFAEFAVLGTLLFMTLYFFNINSTSKKFVVCGATSAAVALTDECLQLFSDGRDAQLSDMLLDICGAMIAVSLCVVFMHFVRVRKKR